MEYEVIRTRRKTIAICIGRNGGVTVRVPLHAPNSLIERFVGEKYDWIVEKSNQMARRDAQRRSFQFSDGEYLPFLGSCYPIKSGSAAAFDGTSFFVPQEENSALRTQIIDLYKKLAEQVILPRVAEYSEKTGWVPEHVRIGSAGTSWGSCSGKNRLNFTWKLVAAPLEVIDYVIVHELAHLVEHNHSVRFWRLVEQAIPDYRESRRKLRALEEELQKIGLG
ncbi:MAG TPA: SprT family zinc-dependent metalloprotease [Caproiciproducens sp.]|nr:SprT family zinc-dependent metalloprotease [Caproiciproducens sp.]